MSLAYIEVHLPHVHTLGQQRLQAMLQGLRSVPEDVRRTGDLLLRRRRHLSPASERDENSRGSAYKHPYKHLRIGMPQQRLQGLGLESSI